MGSKTETEKKPAAKAKKGQPQAPKRGRVIKNKTFKRRTDKREVKANDKGYWS